MPTTPSAQYSLTLRVEIDHRPGMLGKVASAIGDAGGTIGAVDLVQVAGAHTIRDITVETGDASDWPRLTDAVEAVPGAHVLDATDRTFLVHVGGKIELHNKIPLRTRDDLSMSYTPGVARVCSAIQGVKIGELYFSPKIGCRPSSTSRSSTTTSTAPRSWCSPRC